jgi:hypothetical protein|tara:strand:- start:530 stop:943 length:414 start_codon:yes stop_codon:yes gene_type:complete
MIEEGKQLKSILIKILKYFIIIFFTLQVARGEEDSLDVDLDLENLWETHIWEEIEDVVDVYYEVEQVTAVAGVRGAEAEDEALHHLYYRKSMRGIALIDLQKAYGKLHNKLETIKDPQELKKVNSYLNYLRNKIQNS